MASKQEDTFLSYLTQEEKECLGFLIETIDSLEVEDDGVAVLSKGDDTISNEFLDMMCGNHQIEATADGDETHCSGHESKSANSVAMTVSSKINDGATGSASGSHPTAEEQEREKAVKRSGSGFQSMVSNLSQETSYLEQRPIRSLALMPAHAKKFDTILRSGVSVQELRARVVALLDGTEQESPDSRPKGPAIQSNSFRLLRGLEHKAAQWEALHKLGLLKCSESSAVSTSYSLHALNTDRGQAHSMPGLSETPAENDHK
eukprot:gi/632946802/ref/XP_007888738.1/ PREDICTED: uncharacterized protein LOC103176784 [Callorhinchus milii]